MWRHQHVGEGPRLQRRAPWLHPVSYQTLLSAVYPSLNVASPFIIVNHIQGVEWGCQHSDSKYSWTSFTDMLTHSSSNSAWWHDEWWLSHHKVFCSQPFCYYCRILTTVHCNLAVVMAHIALMQREMSKNLSLPRAVWNWFQDLLSPQSEHSIEVWKVIVFHWSQGRS